jgi:Fe-S-cluster containining protein
LLLKERYRVYFPFVDGLFAYDCPSCGYRCCKGAGFAATPSELVTLRRHHPELAYFTQVAQKASEPLVQLVNFNPSCFFLGDDGLCEVHVRHGRAAKPFVCKTFPVNAFRLEGEVLVADMNFLCPLELASPGGAATAIQHEDLLRDIVEHADVVLAAATRQRAPGLSHARIDEEERLRDASAGLGVLDLCALYDGAAGVPEARHGIERFVDTLHTFLRVGSPAAPLRDNDDEETAAAERAADAAADADLERFVVALAPRLRLIAPLEYTWLAPAEATALTGRLCATLALYARLARRVNRSPLSLSTIHGLFARFGHVIYFLAQLGRVPGIEALPEDKWTFHLAAGARQDAQRLLRFIYVDNDDAGCTLGEIFERLGIEDPMQRLQVLQSLPEDAMKVIVFRDA